MRETALRSLLEDQKGELLHQSQSLQQVNADLAQNWTSVRSKQQELNALLMSTGVSVTAAPIVFAYDAPDGDGGDDRKDRLLPLFVALGVGVPGVIGAVVLALVCLRRRSDTAAGRKVGAV